MIFNNEEELLNYTKNIIGKTFKELDTNNILDSQVNDKGILGKIIETGFYHYPNNNIAAADFEKLGIELKVTGYVKNKNGTISAKERLVLSMINYNDIINEEFDFSKLLFKNKKILIIWYEYDYTKDIKDFVITNYQLYDMSNDELVIKNDFDIIKEKVIEGKAHLLSEGDTSYLGACVKGVNGEQKVSQPKSNFLAKPRAFSLKNSYLTGILRNTDFSLEVDNLEYKTVEEYVFAQIKAFIGKTQADIYSEIFHQQLTDVVPKNIGKMISDKLIGTDEELPEKNSLFSKTTYKIKNIPVDSNYYPIERLPFRTIRLSEFDDSWDNSSWKLFFEEITIIALCYEGTKDVPNGFRTLKDIKKITFNSDDIDSFEITYNMIKKAIEERDIRLLPYPGSYSGQALEVAPKGQKGANAYDTFFDNDKTKVCFMMNKDFVYKKLLESSETTIEEEHDDDNSEFSLVENNDLKDINLEDYNSFELFDFNISKDSIFKIIDNRIPLYNIYINKGENLSDIGIPGSKIDNIVFAASEILEKKIIKRSIYELMYQGITKLVCDNLLEKNISVSDLRNSSCEELKEKYDIGIAMSNKIKSAFSLNDQIIIECNKNIDTSNIMMNVLKENTLKDSISVFDFKKLLSKSNYIMENYSRDFAKLYEEDRIENTLFGIKYKLISYFDYLNKLLQEKDYQIIMRRYDGETLEQIAIDYGITRERVRQIEARILRKIRQSIVNMTFEEDRNKEIFVNYPWNEKLFCEVTGLDRKTYSYLRFRYPSPTKDKYSYDENIQELYDIVNDTNFTNEQIQRFKEIAKIIVLPDGSIMDGEKEFLRKFLIKNASNEIEIDELCKLYNESIKQYPELQLTEVNARNLEGRLSRCDYAFFGANHKVRYFDFNGLSDDAVEQLKELIILNDGFYTTEYLFRNNQKLMNELDIRNEYELHNILRLKIDDDENNVYFLRMPNFLVEYHEKDDFILDKIREYSPILVSDFVDIMYEEYGHKKATMLAYLTSYFDSYIKNGLFDIETISIKDDDLLLLSNKLKRDIYTINEIEEILRDNGYSDPSQVITNRNFVKLGYRIRGSYIIKSQYGNIYYYFDNKIENEEMIKIEEDVAKVGAIYNALAYYCKQLKLFKMTDNIYITYKKLSSLGVTNEVLVGIINNIRDTFCDRDYFSINNVLNEIDCSIFDSLGLPDNFMEDIIFYLDDIKTLRINNNRLFSFTKKSMTISNFMYDMVNKYSSISLDDLEKEIMKNYQISIPFDRLRGYLYSTDIFYSDILGKIYSDKNNYYEEVYNE